MICPFDSIFYNVHKITINNFSHEIWILWNLKLWPLQPSKCFILKITSKVSQHIIQCSTKSPIDCSTIGRNLLSRKSMVLTRRQNSMFPFFCREHLICNFSLPLLFFLMVSMSFLKTLVMLFILFVFQWSNICRRNWEIGLQNCAKWICQCKVRFSEFETNN